MNNIVPILLATGLLSNKNGDSLSKSTRRDCYGCKAAIGYGFDMLCSLGFRCEHAIPKEPCPKPMSNAALIRAVKNKEAGVWYPTQADGEWKGEEE